MQNETLTQKLTEILEGMVGENMMTGLERYAKGLERYPDGYWGIDSDKVKAYNQALHDIRSRIPEAVDGILEAVREDMYKLGSLYGADLYIATTDSLIIEKVTKYIEKMTYKPKND